MSCVMYYLFNKRVEEEKVMSVKSGYMIPRLTDGELIRAGLNEGMTELIAEHIYVESKIREGSSRFNIKPTYGKERMRVRKIIEILSKVMAVSEDLVFEH